MIETISVATDGSEAATAAERCAISLAARLRVSLAGITVVEDGSVRAPGDDGLTLPAFPENELAAYYRARADAVARRFSERARSEGIEAACEVVQGQADDRIVEKSQGAGVLAIGRDGRSESAHGALIGSTTDAVIR